MAHQWTDAKYAIDPGKMFRERLVIGRRLEAKLQHVSQDGDAPSFAHRTRLQALQRSDHAGRSAVAAVVDQHWAAGRLLYPAPAHSSDTASFRCQPAFIKAGGVN